MSPTCDMNSRAKYIRHDKPTSNGGSQRQTENHRKSVLLANRRVRRRRLSLGVNAGGYVRIFL